MTVLRLLFVSLALLCPLTLSEALGAQSWDVTVLNEHFIGGGNRDFNAPGLPLVGSVAIRSFVYVFDSPEMAEQGMRFAEDYMLSRIENVPGSVVRPASAPDIGDDHSAFGGTVPVDNETVDTLEAGILVWREGVVVHALAGAGVTGDQIAHWLMWPKRSRGVRSPRQRWQRPSGILR